MRATSSAPALRTYLDRPLASYYLVLGSGGALLALGMVMVFSASSVESLVNSNPNSRSPFTVFERQVVFMLIGLVGLWLGLRLRPSTYRRLAGFGLLAAIFLLSIVLVPGIGLEKFGARRWLDLGLFQLQPSEVAKLALLVWGADLLVRKQKLLGEWRHLLIPLVPVAVLLCALIMLEPDLGTTLCLVLILFGLLWTVGAPISMFLALVAVMLAAVVAAIKLEPYRMQRVLTFMDPFADPEGAGLQSIRGMYALASGGWWGVGLGNSRMKWGLLPHGESDFIFAILGEELGFLGCLILLALFATLAYAGVRIARRTADPFIRLVSSTIVIWLVGQATINVGYVVGLLPVTGIPLPLISSGGTSLILTMFVIGMLAGFARHEPDAVAALRAQGQGRIARLLRLPIPRAAVENIPRRRRPSRGRPPPTTGRQAVARSGSAPVRSGAGSPGRRPPKLGRAPTDARRGRSPAGTRER